MKTSIKFIRNRLIIFWLSIFVMIIISPIEGYTPQLISQDSIIKQPVQDTIIKVSRKNLTDKELKKQLEYEEHQERQKRIDENMKRMKLQSIMMDSLLGDTIKIVH